MRLTALIFLLVTMSCLVKDNREIDYVRVLKHIVPPYKLLESDNPKKVSVYKYIEIDPRNCEYKQWYDTSAYKYVVGVRDDKFVYDKEDVISRLTGSKDIYCDTSDINKLKANWIEFDEEEVKDLPYHLTRGAYEEGVLKLSPLIPTNKRNIYLLFTTNYSKWEYISHNYTLRVTKDKIETLDQRYVGSCHLP